MSKWDRDCNKCKFVNNAENEEPCNSCHFRNKWVEGTKYEGKEDAKKMTIDKESLLKYRNQIIIAVLGAATLYMNHKVNKLEKNTVHNFKKAGEYFGKIDRHMERNFNAVFNNFRILQADMNNVATHVGFQGKLGCNDVMED